ncbi:DUF177 domain-containing protein [Jiella mangrovi]|uniref:DUF177 domain-containing protein n=1 Tax=Jiella mangrovi TaxID=2821407 RepID=A0ABS4BIC6_9HYPH|nr:DUF177 domain-containing protein [Jiella mangrovi]MBP0615710.1 DUF177 domain-containing protein [Jiella mangrovi]
MDAVSPLQMLLPIGPLPAEGRPIDYAASEEECARVAALLEVDRVASIEAELLARPFRRAGVRVSGRLIAVVVQKSVVSLEPVEQRIDEAFDATFLPPPRLPRGVDAAAGGEIFVDPEADDPPEPILGDRIDLGARLYETLALAVEPYPKRPGESFGTVVEDVPEADERPSPFAVLAKISKDRDDGRE